MKIHHIGIIVKDLGKSVKCYLQLKYSISCYTIIDDIQNNRLAFLRSYDGTQVLELIEPLNEFSSVYNCKEGYHHICYDVSDDNNFLENFKAMKIGKVFTKPIIAPALNGKSVVFAMLRNGTIVEFLL